MPSPPFCKKENVDMQSCNPASRSFVMCAQQGKRLVHSDYGSRFFWPAVAKLCQYNAGSNGKLAHALASHLRTAALAEFDKAMAAVFVAGAEVSTLPVCPSLAATHSRCHCFCFCLSARYLSAIDVFSLAAEPTACSGPVVCRLPMPTVYALRIKRCHTLHLAKRPSVRGKDPRCCSFNAPQSGKLPTRSAPIVTSILSCSSLSESHCKQQPRLTLKS